MIIYSTDWTGPVPIDEDDIVTVEELQDVLSAAEKAILQQQITHHDALII